MVVTIVHCIFDQGLVLNVEKVLYIFIISFKIATNDINTRQEDLRKKNI